MDIDKLISTWTDKLDKCISNVLVKGNISTVQCVFDYDYFDFIYSHLGLEILTETKTQYDLINSMTSVVQSSLKQSHTVLCYDRNSCARLSDDFSRSFDSLRGGDEFSIGSHDNDLIFRFKFQFGKGKVLKCEYTVQFIPVNVIESYYSISNDLLFLNNKKSIYIEDLNIFKNKELLDELLNTTLFNLNRYVPEYVNSSSLNLLHSKHKGELSKVEQELNEYKALGSVKELKRILDNYHKFYSILYPEIKSDIANGNYKCLIKPEDLFL